MSNGQSWWARPEFLRIAIAAVAAWFIKTRKGPDKEQQDLIKKAKEQS